MDEYNAGQKAGRRTEWEKGVDQKLDAILEQATATNGRVRSLEQWRDRIIGALLVVSALGAYFINRLDELPKP